MQFEHYALNVPDPRAMADWYVEHCQMRVVVALDGPLYTRFLADATDRVVMELYCNEAAAVPDYSAQHPLIFHHAMKVDDVDAATEALLAAGATRFEELKFDDGTRLMMLRDPWGVPLQLCKRAHDLV